MDHLEEARDLERQDRLVDAANAYEIAAQLEEAVFSIDDYLRVAVLYFVCSDFGYSSAKHLPEQFAGATYGKTKSWLARARVRFGDRPEIRFWELYCGFVVLGERPFLQGRTSTK